MKEDPLQTVLNRMHARNNSEQTIARFELYVKKFLEYLQQKKIKFKDADCDIIMNYLGETKACGSTKATMFYAYRTLYKIWGKKWTLEKSDVPKKSAPNQPWYNNAEVEKIIATADKISFQASALAHIGRDCGCRRAAIHKMTRNDFSDVDPPSLIVPDVKHGRSVKMLIATDTAHTIREMLKRRKDKCEAMFVGENEERMSLVRLSNLFHRIAVRSGVYKNRAGIHAMRRGKVTRLRAAGIDEFDIVETMGWRIGSPMVHTYCMLDNSDIQRKAALADPLLKNGGKKQKDGE
jgi:site-specific recombinase XerD